MEAKKKFKFRNYKPISDDLKESRMEDAMEVDDMDDWGISNDIKNQDEEQDQFVSETTDTNQEISSNEIQEIKEEVVPMEELVPKSPNWDLKRDIEPKLEILNSLTEKAIINIIKQQSKQYHGPIGGTSMLSAMEIASSQVSNID